MSSPIQEIPSTEALDRFLAENPDRLKMIKAYLTFCGGCWRSAPVFIRAAERHADMDFGQVEVAEVDGICERFQIVNVPAFLVVYKGRVLRRCVGGGCQDSDFDVMIEAAKMDIRVMEKDVETDEEVELAVEGGADDNDEGKDRGSIA